MKRLITMTICLALLLCGCSSKPVVPDDTNNEVNVRTDRINFPEGNDYANLEDKDIAAVKQTWLAYTNIEEFAEKLSTLNFTEMEKIIIKRHWDRDEDGIIICPTNYYYKLNAPPNVGEIGSVNWDGNRYSYRCPLSSKGMVICTIYFYKDYNSSLDAFFEGKEAAKEAVNAIRITESSEVKDGINHTIYDYTNGAGKQREVCYKFSHNESEYMVVESYSTKEIYEENGKEIGTDLDINKPLSVRINITSQDADFMLYFFEPNIEFTKEYITQIEFEKVKLKS